MKPKTHIPPQLADRFLSWFCRGELLEEILGDLHEYFEEDLIELPKWRRTLFYWFHLINFLRPFAIKKSRSINLNFIAMFNNYFKIAWRNLYKYRMYSGIKIGGFAIGIAAFILISLFVLDELSYDQHYERKDDLYRVLNVSTDPNQFGRWPAFPPMVKQVLEGFPEVEKVGRLIPYSGWFDGGNNQFRKVDDITNIYEEGFAYLDNEMLDILEIPMVYGDQQTALNEPNSIVISERKASKYYPNQNPVGETIILNNDETKPFIIGGVMENMPSNSHLQFDFFITLSGKEFWEGEQTDWCCWNYNPYVRLKPGVNVEALEEKLLVIRDDYVIPHKKKKGEVIVADLLKYHTFDLQAVGDIHLRSTDVEDVGQRGDMKVVWMFVAIACFILVLACINFINLSTAKSANRAKEVGLRKVVGSFRSHLIHQFLTESMVFSAISVIIGLIFAWLLLPYFNDLANKNLALPISAWWAAPVCISFILLTGIIAGIYPAFYLSAFKPVDVLKGSLSRGSKNSKLRTVMVVFQFTTSLVLIVGAFMVHRQMSFLLNKKLGFDKEQVLLLQGVNTLGDKMHVFKDELKLHSKIKNVAISDYLPIDGSKRDGNSFWIEGRQKIDRGVGAQRWRVDIDYINTMGMKIVKGRDFSEMASDSSAIIINQTMAKELGLDNPVGAQIRNWQTWNVIGVVEDFHFQSMRDNDIAPLGFCRTDFGSVMPIKIEGGDMIKTIESITQTWDEFMPAQRIRYTFLDDGYAQMYGDVQRTGHVFTAFAILAVIVACLGLFGLSAFMVEQRNKEISIRKVLGASLHTIFQLLTFNFLKMVIISLLIAVPIGWYLMDLWLADFNYRTEITWDVFAIAGLMVVIISLLTVSFESLKAAVVSPTRGLRSE
ncbi:MAG: ABC transporter permease [Cyclobacteriaceae bacterium]